MKEGQKEMTSIERKLAFLMMVDEDGTPRPWIYDSYSSIIGAFEGGDPEVVAEIPYSDASAGADQGQKDCRTITVSRNHLRALTDVADALKQVVDQMPGYERGAKALAALAEVPDA